MIQRFSNWSAVGVQLSRTCWCLALHFTMVVASVQATSTEIEFWYGDKQTFGNAGGHPQRWINVLGEISSPDEIATLTWTLNGSEPRSLSFREDRKRIAKDGDFNVEIDRDTLKAGSNTVQVIARDKDGVVARRSMTVNYLKQKNSWQLPYEIDWSEVDNIQEVCQVVDGKWDLTPEGIRSVQRYYDRNVVFGDSSWKDYEVATTVTFHALTAPKTGPNSTDVTHAAIALRWPGHDEDGKQPSVKWHPLGATAEFRLGRDLKKCRWRIFDGKFGEFYVESKKRRELKFETPYHMKHRVETLSDGRSRYRAKLWPVGKPEPSDWDLERFETNDLASGSAVLLAHHSDVTFGNVLVTAITPQQVATNASTQHETSGAFVYDPITGSSRRNHESNASKHISETIQGVQSGGSFTIEAFAKPSPKLETRPRDFLPVFKSKGNNHVLEVGILRSTAPHSYNWWTARIRQDGKPPLVLARNRYRGQSMVTEDTPWRHLALTWNAQTRIASYFLDYQLQSAVVLDASPNWDVSGFDIGSRAGEKTFVGLTDEVRVTAKALPPWHFLRASSVPLKNVSYAPDTKPKLPSDYGHANVRLHYGAIGDGQHDDTAAIRRAFAENQNRVPNEYRTVYFPAGTYLISDTIQFNRFMVVRGAGKDRTIIKLMDKSDGFTTPDVPKPAFAVGYDWPYVDRPKKNRAGNVIGNYIFDLSIDTGHGNSSALGLDFHCNNIGCVENVDITSGDGSGMVGLDLKRGWPGPCLIKNMTITGFDVGIAAAHREYSLVFSGIRLNQQRVAGIANEGNVLSLENVVSENEVPAMQNQAGGLIVLINSQLSGGGSSNTAIESDNASLYLRNVKVGGYGNSVIETNTPKGGTPTIATQQAARMIDEYYTGPFDHAFKTKSAGSLKLKIKQTPDVAFPSIDEWVNVRDFEHLVEKGDWSTAIQAAIDSGEPLIYFPDDAKYKISSDVIVRGNVRTLLGGSPKTKVANGYDESPKDGPAFVLDASLPMVQFHMLGVGHLRHFSPTTLLLRHCNCDHITTGPNCGDLFIEDTGGKFRFNKNQRVWARQLNPETKGIPEIINNGGQLWVLGLKTEYLSTKIENLNGARTEVLGGLMYPVQAVKDETLPMFLNEDSDISLIHGTSVYGKNHKIYIKDTQRGETRDHVDWHWIGGRPITNLYRSDRQ